MLDHAFSQGVDQGEATVRVITDQGAMSRMSEEAHRCHSPDFGPVYPIENDFQRLEEVSDRLASVSLPTGRPWKAPEVRGEEF
jgi:hypothetical protein